MYIYTIKQTKTIIMTKQELPIGTKFTSCAGFKCIIIGYNEDPQKKPIIAKNLETNSTQYFYWDTVKKDK